MHLPRAIAVCLCVLYAISLIAQTPNMSELKAKAENGDARAQVALALAYEKGEGAPQNDALAARWFRAAAEQGDAEAQNALGVLYRLGRGVEQDKAGAVEWYRKAAKQGYGPAMFNLGTAYYNGDGIGISDQYAYAWFALAARAGSRDGGEAVQRMETELSPERITYAKLLMTDMLRKAEGVPKDPGFAFQVLDSMKESAVARFETGRMLAEGEGVPQNYDEAMKRLNSSDSVAARLYIAEMYLDGRGVPRDVNKAVEYLKKSGVQNPTVNLKIADRYWSGESVARDYKKAVKYYSVAADTGDARGLYMLALAGRDGLGLKESLEQSCMYFVLSVTAGNAEASKEGVKSCDAAAWERGRAAATVWLTQHPAARQMMKSRQDKAAQQPSERSGTM